jgi:hypothetical protein
MKATVRDSAMLASVRPLELASYLRSNGWEAQEWVPETYSVWIKRTDAGSFEVTLPLIDRFRDYSLRISEILATLEAVERRSQLEIISDLNTANADVVRVSSHHRGMVNESIPIEDAVLLVQRSRDLMLSAACSTIEPRSYYPPRKFAQALDFLHRVRMGQTERGSYVVTIVSPVPPALEDAAHHVVEDPYERRVTKKLSSALLAVQRAAERAIATATLDPFREAVQAGVSANLCDAIVGMAGTTGESRGVAFRFTWSRSRPLQDDNPNGVLFSADAMPVIQEAGRVLREEAPIEEFELQGVVVALERPAGAEVGTVTVLGFVEERPRRVRMELRDPEYILAVRAHADRTPVLCAGVLVKEGRSYVLAGPLDFRLAPIEP